MHPLLLHYYTWAGGNTHTKDIYIKREGGREGETFAKPAGKGEIILNAVGRLSNLYLFIKKGGPTGANG